MRNLVSRVSGIVRDRGGLANAVRTGLSRPGAVAHALGRVAMKDWRVVAAGSQQVAKTYLDELHRTGLIENLNHRLSDEFTRLQGVTVRGRAAAPGGMRPLHAEMLWLLVRARAPRRVVETGVCNGLSSAVLLEALAANGDGRLISVDLPEFTDPRLNTFEVWHGKGGAAIPAEREVGWLVHNALRPSWRLELGSSKEILPPLLKELAPIDLFIHDSEHSYENQLFEFEEGFAALKPGGVLVATDITWSDAFDHFWAKARDRAAARAFVDPSCAIVMKA